jgi:PHD/YefM family antitoxin component YafN of YafNO toxin-antitoxin module
MKAISLKLPEDLLETSRHYAAAMHLSLAAYIRLAVEKMNREFGTRARSKRMAEASRRVRGESARVNAEFAAIEQDPDA